MDLLGRWKRAALALGGVAVALAVGVVVLWVRGPEADPRALVEIALQSDLVRKEAVRELVEGGAGVWDSYLDPDVGRVLQPEVEEREFRGVPISSNAWGMREEAYELEKPAGGVRIVLLGDSFVFGYGVAAADRLGVRLREFLTERADGTPIEVLHLAVTSWNIRAECAYLRRQLDRLRPDLVVQVIVVNDLEDLRGVRGFGGMGGYSPQRRRRANGLLATLTPRKLFPKRLPTYLVDGLDGVSRGRYAEAARELADLARAVEAVGGRYLALAAWEGYNPMVKRYFEPALGEARLAYVSAAFTKDLRYRLGPSDRHWNPLGHEAIATLLYGLIVERGLLEGLDLPEWDRAAQAVREIHGRGAAEARRVAEYEALLRARGEEQIQPYVDLVDLKQRNAKQIHGGIDAEGNVAPFAAVVLRNPGAGTLRIRGRRFPAPVVGAGRTRVQVEGRAVGEFLLAGAAELDERFALPADLADVPFLGVTFESDDWALVDVATGACAAFVLERVSLE